MAGAFFAHTLPGEPPDRWQSLDAHLSRVGGLAEDFAADFDSADWGRLAGQWHDLGKYSSEFQNYLREAANADAHTSELKGKVDHSTAGGQYAAGALGIPGHLLAYVITGHHSGLLDARGDGANLADRLVKTIPVWSHAAAHWNDASVPSLPNFVRHALGARDHFAVAFFTRMLYSCLVDADFLDTEAFMSPEKAAARPVWPSDLLETMAGALEEHVSLFQDRGLSIDRVRSEVRAACVGAAEQEPGLFSLTVPTGGGKTLSSLGFALHHAARWGMKRVVYVAPFTTIIEQNAEVFRRALSALESEFGMSLLVEHHSNLDGEQQTVMSRLASENWHAPLIVTTTVQFYESLFANRSSRCRKLHNLTKSVIILDEAQKLPVDLLEPTLRALKELAENYGATVVLCTATQPAVHRRGSFHIGLDGVREIMPDPRGLYESLRRVQIADRGKMTDTELGAALKSEDQILCIVNTRRHAQLLYNRLAGDDAAFHLSASMCAAHRSVVLAEIRVRLAAGNSCRVVSTQVVESGVDLDFPVVFRSIAGIDSLAQSAGRCNRNGRLNGFGRVYTYRSEHDRSEKYFAETADVAAQVMALHDDPLSLEAVEHYFRLYYWGQSGRWDSRRIMDDFRLVRDPQLPFDFRFATVATKYRLIDDGGRNVIIPWGETGRMLCEQLRATGSAPAGALLRKLQRYVVQVPSRIWHEQLGRGLELVHDRYPILVSPELNYLEATGLDFGNELGEFHCY